MRNQSTEDYLKGVYRLRGKNRRAVSTSDLARHLHIGDGSVTDMLKRLSAKKLLHYVPYQGVTLTEEGSRLAMKTIRRHRLWEMFLVRHLGYGWDEVHEEAERLEHVTSSELEARLDRALGSPALDPHGDPIPTADGELDEPHHRSLAECPPGTRCRVRRVSDADKAVLRYLGTIGLTLDAALVVDRTGADGATLVTWNGTSVLLAPAVARAVFVEEVAS
jgi:DtxR family Mn-dependent transcriptional regulator